MLGGVFGCCRMICRQWSSGYSTVALNVGLWSAQLLYCLKVRWCGVIETLDGVAVGVVIVGPLLVIGSFTSGRPVECLLPVLANSYPSLG